MTDDTYYPVKVCIRVSLSPSRVGCCTESSFAKMSHLRSVFSHLFHQLDPDDLAVDLSLAYISNQSTLPLPPLSIAPSSLPISAPPDHLPSSPSSATQLSTTPPAVPIEEVNLAWRLLKPTLLDDMAAFPSTWGTPGLGHPQRLFFLKNGFKSLVGYHNSTLWKLTDSLKLEQALAGGKIASFLNRDQLLLAAIRSGSSTTSVLTLLSPSTTATTLCLTN